MSLVALLLILALGAVVERVEYVYEMRKKKKQ